MAACFLIIPIVNIIYSSLFSSSSSGICFEQSFRSDRTKLGGANTILYIALCINCQFVHFFKFPHLGGFNPHHLHSPSCTSHCGFTGIPHTITNSETYIFETRKMFSLATFLSNGAIIRFLQQGKSMYFDMSFGTQCRY